MKVKNSLLEDLARLSNKSCLSDLHNIPLLDLISIIEEMDCKRYSVEQWNYGLAYILRAKINLQSTSDIIQTLVSFKN